MPTGDFTVIEEVIRELRKEDPYTILDIGPGFGKWGFLAREYLELWGHRNYLKKSWLKRIDCCEVWPDYITEMHHYIYSNVYVEDIRTFVKKMINYDTIVMIDVIEHFEKEEAKLLIKELQEKTNKSLIIGTPLRWSPQKAAYNNPHETHRSLWTLKDFEELGFKKLGNKEMPILAVYKK